MYLLFFSIASVPVITRAWGIMFTGCLSFNLHGHPFLLNTISKICLEEFLQFWHKCKLRLSDELIRIWWPKVKVTVTPCSFSCYSPSIFVNAISKECIEGILVNTNVQLESMMNWLDFGGQGHTGFTSIWFLQPILVNFALREFIQIRYKLSLRLMDELIWFWWSNVKGQVHCDILYVPFLSMPYFINAWKKYYYIWNNHPPGFCLDRHACKLQIIHFSALICKLLSLRG